MKGSCFLILSLAFDMQLCNLQNFKEQILADKLKKKKKPLTVLSIRTWQPHMMQSFSGPITNTPNMELQH